MEPKLFCKRRRWNGAQARKTPDLSWQGLGTVWKPYTKIWSRPKRGPKRWWKSYVDLKRVMKQPRPMYWDWKRCSKRTTEHRRNFGCFLTAHGWALYCSHLMTYLCNGMGPGTLTYQEPLIPARCSDEASQAEMAQRWVLYIIILGSSPVGMIPLL